MDKINEISELNIFNMLSSKSVVLILSVCWMTWYL